MKIFHFSYINNKYIKKDEPITFEKANEHSRWQDAMLQEMELLTKNKTCTLVDLPLGKKEISSKWM